MQKLSRPIVFAAAGVAVVAMTGCGKSEKAKKAETGAIAGKTAKSHPAEGHDGTVKQNYGGQRRPSARDAHQAKMDAEIKTQIGAFAGYAEKKLDSLFNSIEAIQTKLENNNDKELLEKGVEELLKKTEGLAEKAKTDQDAARAALQEDIKKFKDEVLAKFGDDGPFSSFQKSVQDVVGSVSNKVASLTSSQENLEQQLEAAKKDVAAAQAKVEAMGEQLQTEMQGRGQMDEEAQQKMIEALEAKIQPLLDDVEKAKKKQDAIEAQQKQPPPVASSKQGEDLVEEPLEQAPPE